jgi:hypothetical protein
MPPIEVTVDVVEGDARAVPADVLVLKHAQRFHGLDEKVARELGLREGPSVGDYLLVRAPARYAVHSVLFVGVPYLSALSYADLHGLSAQGLRALSVDQRSCRHVLMTLHGAGFGLNETQAAAAQFAGVADAVRKGLVPPRLERITFVEYDRERAARIETLLSTMGEPEPPPANRSASGASGRLPVDAPPAGWGGGAPLPAARQPDGPDAREGFSAGAAEREFEVFISYNSADEAYAARLYEVLEGRGMRVFFSKRSIPELAHSDYVAAIHGALDQAAHMVVVAGSAERTTSGWVRSEWSMFLNEKLSGRKSGNLVVLRTQPFPIGQLPIALRACQVVDFSDEDGAEVLRYLR